MSDSDWIVLVRDLHVAAIVFACVWFLAALFKLFSFFKR